MDKSLSSVTEALSGLRNKHGLSHHPLTMDDFHHICEKEAVDVIVADIRTKGLLFKLRGLPIIALDSKLEPAELLFVAYHELGHYLMQHGPIKGSDIADNNGKIKDSKEIEADLFAEFAIASG